MFRTVPLSIIRTFSLYTQQWYMSYKLADSRIRTELEYRPDPARKLSANLNDIYHCCVYSEKVLMMDRAKVRNMQSFIPKINLRNQCIQVHLVGFIIRIYHDARSDERHFPFTKPKCAHLTYTTIQSLVYSYMFRRNSAISRQSIYQHLKLTTVYYITIITHVVSYWFLQINKKKL